MLEYFGHPLIAFLTHTLLVLAVIARILLRPHRDPASRVAWIMVVGALPFLGMFAYLLLGETNIGRRRVARLQAALARLPKTDDACFRVSQGVDSGVPERHQHIFRLAQSISGFEPVGGNKGTLMADSNAAIDAMVADVDAATDHVHLLF